MCLKTRKPTIGGVRSIGHCTIKHWSATHALSSAETGLYAATRAFSDAKGRTSFGQDFGEDLRITAWVDSEATIGLGFRAGLGRASHVETAEGFPGARCM